MRGAVSSSAHSASTVFQCPERCDSPNCQICQYLRFALTFSLVGGTSNLIPEDLADIGDNPYFAAA
jgi:hypothetical protein